MLYKKAALENFANLTENHLRFISLDPTNPRTDQNPYSSLVNFRISTQLSYERNLFKWD